MKTDSWRCVLGSPWFELDAVTECFRYQLAPMGLAESAQYLRHHLALVGRTDPLFADDAISRLHKVSLGLPRALNNAAIAALIAAATAGKALVDDDCAKRRLPSLPTTDCCHRD